MKKIIAVFIWSLLFMSCEEERNAIVFEPVPFAGAFAADIDVTIENAQGNTLAAQAINTAIEQQLIALIPNAEMTATLHDALVRFNADYNTFKTTFEDETQVWELSLETELIYQSPTIITIGLSSYADTGGAHGNDTIKLLNFNAITGALYTQSDMISNLNEFKTLAKTYFAKAMAEKKQETFAEDESALNFKLPENMGFSDDGVILLYNVYEIGSYAEGYTEFTIPYEAVEAFLKVSP